MTSKRPLTNRHTTLLATAAGIAVANVYSNQPLLELLASRFGLSLAATGWIITVTQIGSLVALLTLVPAGDRHDRRGLLLRLAAALVLVLLICAASPSTPILLLAMFGLGLLGTAMTQSLIATAASLSAPAERGRVVGAAQSGVVLGILLARTLAGVIADLAGWRAVYLVSAGLVAAAAWAVIRKLPAMRPADPGLDQRQLLRSMAGLLRHSRVLQIRGLLGLLVFAAFGIFWSAIALYLRTPAFGLSHSAIGALGLVGAVGALAASRAGRLADRGYAPQVTGWGFGLLLAAWALLALLEWPGISGLAALAGLTPGTMPGSTPGTTGLPISALLLLVVGVIVLDLAGQAIHVTNQWYISRIDPTAQSRLVACYMLFYAVGVGAGAATASFAFEQGGWLAVCRLGALVSAAGLVVWLLTRQRIGNPQALKPGPVGRHPAPAAQTAGQRWPAPRSRRTAGPGPSTTPEGTGDGWQAAAVRPGQSRSGSERQRCP